MTAAEVIAASLESKRQADCVRMRRLIAATPDRRIVRSLPAAVRLVKVPCAKCGRKIAAPAPGAICGTCAGRVQQ